MNHWLFKSDPETYSAHDLERDKQTVWDGVHNPVAIRNIRAMAVGDGLLIYHTGDEKAILALGKVVGPARDDPKDKRSAVVDIAFERWLKRPVTLAEVKADTFFAEFALVRQARLSVMPVSEEQWQRLMKMAENPKPG